MKSTSLKAAYRSEASLLAAQLARLKRRNLYFVAGEITSFIAMLGFIVLATTLHNAAWTLWLAAVCLALYVIIRRFDVRNEAATTAIDQLRQAYEDEARYLEGDFTPFDDGACHADAHHPFALDLDIFGPSSLFHRLNRTVSTGGSHSLAQSLTCLPGSTPQAKTEVEQKRDAIDELGTKQTWRMHFIAQGKGKAGGIDSARLTQAIAAASAVNIPRFATALLPFALAYASIVSFFASVLLAIFTPLDANIPIWWGMINFFAVMLLCAKPLRAVSKTANLLHSELTACVQLLTLITAEEMRAALNKQLKTELEGALHAFKQLEQTVGSLDRRSNILGLMFANALFLSDFFLVRKFLKWQDSNLQRFPQWVDSLSQMDALVSLGTFRYNHPEAVQPQIEDAPHILYHATNLRHPFLGTKAVGNDLQIRQGQYHIVTGANMAGKSTFLRCVGVNYVLAMAGLPVFASEMRVSCFWLFSSMRTTDDLTHGISYFNAELLRLEQLIDYCQQHPNTFIILDEILKGTNSLDKLNGSRLFLQTMSQMPASGIVATHDLELSKLEDEDSARFANYCFEIELGNDVTYSYRITRGVAKNQNATFLLKKILNR